MHDDLQHLRLLSILHYVMGGIATLGSCFPGAYLAIGIAMLSGAMKNNGRGQPPPPEIGWLLAVMGGVGLALIWALAICLVVAGRRLQKRSGYVFCFVIACIECCFVPLGTLLGVFTIITLSKPGVKYLFENPDIIPGDRYERFDDPPPRRRFEDEEEDDYRRPPRGFKDDEDFQGSRQ